MVPPSQILTQPNCTITHIWLLTNGTINTGGNVVHRYRKEEQGNALEKQGKAPEKKSRAMLWRRNAK